ncbi:MAG: TIR domain-containing protein [Endomicrobium sp.]|nr:TIR domain-containing protein [Endomicrobium sp.]
MRKRRVFYSFHYEKDVMRASTIRNIGVIGGLTKI